MTSSTYSLYFLLQHKVIISIPNFHSVSLLICVISIYIYCCYIYPSLLCFKRFCCILGNKDSYGPSWSKQTSGQKEGTRSVTVFFPWSKERNNLAHYGLAATVRTRLPAELRGDSSLFPSCFVTFNQIFPINLLLFPRGPEPHVSNLCKVYISYL